MSAKPEPESGAEKGAKVHFAPDANQEGMDEDDPERGEYVYPDLEHLCKLNESMMSDEEYAQATGKLGPAALCAQRGAGNAAAAAKVVGDNRKVGTQRRKPPSAQTTISAAPSSVASGP